jgi:hypothetical protein
MFKSYIQNWVQIRHKKFISDLESKGEKKRKLEIENIKKKTHMRPCHSHTRPLIRYLLRA